VAAVGGLAGLGGSVTVTVAGFWIGWAPPVAGVDPLLLSGAVQLVAQDNV
jgi:uncharacterized membrane protein YfcA